jgi:hypothetical protein
MAASRSAAELLTVVRACAKQRKIRFEHVFFGGEDYPSYAENFLRHPRQEKFLVVRVNAWEAKQQRDNFQASSDSLHLLGIARCCLNRRGESVRDLPEAYPNLRIAVRDRDKLVRMAAGWTAELGPPSQWRPVHQLCSHSGVVPKIKQTGGPNNEATVGAVQQR